MPDTYTSQFSGEEIDAALRAAQIISGADTPAELRKKLEIRGDTIPVSATDPTPVSEALSASGGGINPNLLDNWFFGRPVNQRGQSEYTGGYCIDRWRLKDGDVATFQDDALNISYTAAGWNLDTLLDKVLIPGVTYTLSCLYKATGQPIRLVCSWGNSRFFFNEQAPISDDWAVAEITGTIPADASIDINQIVVQSLNTGSGSFSLKAIKLELGDQQTLAHKENGVWVLNEIPDYGEQLRRCQRYCVDVTPSLSYNSMYGGTLHTAGCDFLVPIPVTLRESDSAPVVICNPSEWQVAVVAANAYFTPTSISVSQTASGAVGLRCLFSHSLSSQYCDLRKAVDSAKLLLSKDL